MALARTETMIFIVEVLLDELWFDERDPPTLWFLASLDMVRTLHTHIYIFFFC